MSCVTLGKYLTSLRLSFLICNMNLPSEGCCENRGSKYVKSTQNSRAWGGLNECVLRVGAPALPMPPAWCPISLSLTLCIPRSPWLSSCLNAPSSFLLQGQLYPVPSVQKAFPFTSHVTYPWVSVQTSPPSRGRLSLPSPTSALPIRLYFLVIAFIVTCSLFFLPELLFTHFFASVTGASLHPRSLTQVEQITRCSPIICRVSE